jgi:phosphatidylserine decarboxylase
MNGTITIRYIDRRSGYAGRERIYASRFLNWAYNTPLGLWATDRILRKRWVSWFYGWWNKRWWTRYKIRPLVWKLSTDPMDTLPYIRRSKSFNDFFTRRINLATRPIDPDPHTCIAPVDGKVLVFPEISPAKAFRIKRATFDLETFLRNRDLANKYAAGTMIVSRLCIIDYHHFHFPDSGTPHRPIPMPGYCHASGPYARTHLMPYYSENYRVLTLFDSDHFGCIAIVDVGAMAVGSIHERFTPGERVARGSHKGYFELGGSTVVLLFEKGCIVPDSDLITNSQTDTETYVHYGDSLGKVPGENGARAQWR